MSTATIAAPLFRLTPRARKAVVVAHVVSSVALLGQVWVNAVVAVVAMRSGDPAGYRVLRDLVFGSAMPLSMIALVTGIVLSLGTKWGLLRFPWVTAKLVLLVLTVLLGATVQGRLVERLIVEPTPALQWAQLAGTGAQLAMLVVATWLSVFKPGGRRLPRNR